VFNPASNGGAVAPFDIKTQLATAAQVNGSYKEGDLILVDGGGNDFADLVGAYLGAGTPAGAAAFQGFLLQQLTPAEVQGIFASNPAATAPVVAAGAYATKLADTYYNSIKVNTLDKGANRVAVLNAPDVLLTPRFQAVLGGVAAQAGAATSAALAGATRGWISAFNNQLRTRIGSDSRVALVDFYADFTDQVNNPASYGLVNATQAVCPVVGVDGGGLPAYDFPTCTSTALNARAPAGMGAGWYDQYAFSDGFHPTPYGHKLLAAGVSRALARAGFL
jgi:outer membrane lipase/esterase